MIKNTLPNKSGNPESLKKIITTVGELFNKCARSWRGFAEGALQVALQVQGFVFQVISEKRLQERFYKEFKKYFYMKMIVTIIPTNLVTN